MTNVPIDETEELALRHPALQIVFDDVVRCLGSLQAVRTQLTDLKAGGRQYYSDRQGFRYHANVKLHGASGDLDKALAAARVPKSRFEAANDYFSDSYQSTLFDEGITAAREDFLSLFRDNSPFDGGYWLEAIAEQEAKFWRARGRERKLAKESLVKLRASLVEAETLHAATRQVAENDAGFFGRGGGHFCFTTTSGDIEAAAERILDGLSVDDAITRLTEIQLQFDDPAALIGDARQRWLDGRDENHPLVDALPVEYSALTLATFSVALSEGSLESVMTFLTGNCGDFCGGSETPDSMHVLVRDAVAATEELVREDELACWLVDYAEKAARGLNFQYNLDDAVHNWLVDERTLERKARDRKAAA